MAQPAVKESSAFTAGRAVADEALLSLEFLDRMDDVIDALKVLIRMCRINSQRFALLQSELSPEMGELDPEMRIQIKLEEAEGHLAGMEARLRHDVGEGLDSATSRPEDAEVYQEAITELASLRRCVMNYRWAMMEHDADVDECSDRTFDTVEELMADLYSE